MRDGIYKNLPLSPPWRTFLKSCTLEAERGDISRSNCEHAITYDLYRQVKAGLRRSIRDSAQISESLLTGFSALGAMVSSRNLGGQNCPLENEILASFRDLEGSGLKGLDLEKKAYIRGLSEYLNRCKRQIEQTILADGLDSDSRQTIEAARNALCMADVVGIVEKFVTGLEANNSRPEWPIELDEDLAKPRP